MLSVINTLFLYTGLLLGVPYTIGKVVKIKSFNRYMYLLFVSFVCALFASFRGTSGTDSQMYISAYTLGADAVHRWVNFEIGFNFLCRILRSLGLPYQCMFFVMCLVPTYCSLLAISYEKENIYVNVATLIFVVEIYFFTLNGMRQGFALGVSLLAIVLYFRDKKIAPLFLLIIAVLFHKSAIICLSAVVCREIFCSKYRRFFLIIALLVLFYLVKNRNILGKIASIVTSSDYYAGYFTRDAYVDTSMFKYYLKKSPIIIFCIISLPKLRNNRTIYICFAMMLLGIVISSLGAVTGTQVARIGRYFSMFDIFVLGYIAKQKTQFSIGGSNTTKIINRLMIYSYYILIFYYEIFYKGFSNLVPFGV